MQAGLKLSAAAVAIAAALTGCGAPPAANPNAGPDMTAATCEALRELPNLTITLARLVEADADTPRT